MQCPGCGENITEKDTVCPKCKKVLKLICPVCNTSNTKKICSNCGHHIITKCYNCGKIVQTAKGICPNCKTNTRYSLFLNTADTEEFTVFTIEFPNVDKIKWAMGEKKCAKFLVKLYSAIQNILNTKNVTIEQTKSSFYVACNKSSSLKTSMQDGIKLSIDILSLISRVNLKITKYIPDTIKCVITMSIIDSFSENKEIISFMDLYEKDNKKINSLSDVQLLMDFQLYSNLKDTFEYNFISSTYKGKREIMLFNINIAKYIDLTESERLNGKDVVSGRYRLPEFKEDLSYINIVNSKNEYNKNLINFKSVKCSWDKLNAYEFKDKIAEYLKNNEKFFTSYSAPDEYSISEGEILTLFTDNETKKLHTVVCTNKMKYEPYGLLKHLLITLYDIRQAEGQSLADLYKYTFAAEDKHNYIGNLLNNKIIENPEEAHEELTKALYNLIKNHPNAVIYIKNFENADETSKIVFEQFVNNFDLLPLSWIISLNSSTKLHDIYKKLLLNPKYFEVTMLPMSFEKIIEPHLNQYKDILDNYYINRIALCAKGSLSFVSYALKYLKLTQVIKIEKGIFAIDIANSIVIPASLADLIKKRITALSQYPAEFNVWLFSVFLEDVINVKALQEAFPEYNLSKIFQNLENFGFITKEYNNYRIEEYNLSLKYMLEVVDKDKLNNIIEILQKNSVTLYDFNLKAYCAELTENKIDCLNMTINSIELNSSLGDHYALLTTIRHFLSLLKHYDISTTDEGIKEKKDAIYMEIVRNAQHYNPEHISDIINSVADTMAKQSNTNALYEIYTNTLKSCLKQQNYINAFCYIQNLQSLISEKENNADATVLLLLKTDILFNLGYTKTAIEMGYEIIDNITPEFLQTNKKTVFSGFGFETIFNKFVNDILYMTIFENKIKISEFKERYRAKIDISKYNIELFENLELLLRGKNYKLTNKESYKNSDEAQFLFYILEAYTVFEDTEKFANAIYSASLIATKTNNVHNEYLCNLLIAYSYIRMENYKKAQVILDVTQEKSDKKGFLNINYITSYMFILLKSKTFNDIPKLIDFLLMIMQKTEADENICLYINIIFKRLCAELLEKTGDTTKAKYYEDTAKEMFL